MKIRANNIDLKDAIIFMLKCSLPASSVCLNMKCFTKKATEKFSTKNSLFKSY